MPRNSKVPTKVREFQVCLIRKAYVRVSEGPEKNIIVTEKEMEDKFEASINEENNLTAGEKSLVRLGNEVKILDGGKLWGRAKDYKREFSNTWLRIWKTNCSPSGTQNLNESFDLLWRHIWFKKQLDKRREALQKK